MKMKLSLFAAGSSVGAVTNISICAESAVSLKWSFWMICWTTLVMLVMLVNEPVQLNAPASEVFPAANWKNEVFKPWRAHKDWLE